MREKERQILRKIEGVNVGLISWFGNYKGEFPALVSGENFAQDLV